MSTKKVTRTRRAERKKESQERRRQGTLILAVVVLGVLLVLATALIFGTGAGIRTTAASGRQPTGTGTVARRFVVSVRGYGERETASRAARRAPSTENRPS